MALKLQRPVAKAAGRFVFRDGEFSPARILVLRGGAGVLHRQEFLQRLPVIAMPALGKTFRLAIRKARVIENDFC